MMFNFVACLPLFAFIVGSAMYGVGVGGCAMLFLAIPVMIWGETRRPI